jgi:hypothetical protein
MTFISSYLKSQQIIWKDDLNRDFPDKEELFRNTQALSQKEYIEIISDLSKEIRTARQRFTENELVSIMVNNEMVFSNISELKVFLEEQAKLAPKNRKLMRLASLSEEQLKELIDNLEKTSLLKEMGHIRKYNINIVKEQEREAKEWSNNDIQGCMGMTFAILAMSAIVLGTTTDIFEKKPEK